MAMQLEDCVDFFFALFSHDSHRLVFELDHSQAYKRFADDAHIIKHFNLKPGSSAPFVRDVTVTSDSLGPHDHESKLKDGDVLKHECLPADPPTKGCESMHQNDRFHKPKNHDKTAKEFRECLKDRNLSTEGNVSDLSKLCKNANPPIATKKLHGKLIKGCAGAQLGLMELSWRRG